MIPENFLYFSLDLTQNSVERLENIILQNKDIQKVIQSKNVTGKYLSHCTLLYRNSCIFNQSLLSIEEIYDSLKENSNKLFKIKVIGWGWNEKALAFLIDSNSISLPKFKDHKYHVTICTFNNGKPFESNNIKNWGILFVPIEIDCFLTETTIK